MSETNIEFITKKSNYSQQVLQQHEFSKDIDIILRNQSKSGPEKKYKITIEECVDDEESEEL